MPTAFCAATSAGIDLDIVQAPQTLYPLTLEALQFQGIAVTAIAGVDAQVRKRLSETNCPLLEGPAVRVFALCVRLCDSLAKDVA